MTRFNQPYAEDQPDVLPIPGLVRDEITERVNDNPPMRSSVSAFGSANLDFLVRLNDVGMSAQNNVCSGTHNRAGNLFLIIVRQALVFRPEMEGDGHDIRLGFP